MHEACHRMGYWSGCDCLLSWWEAPNCYARTNWHRNITIIATIRNEDYEKPSFRGLPPSGAPRGFQSSIQMDVEPKIGENTQNGWFIMENPWKTLLKWMIWGFSPYFWKHSNPRLTMITPKTGQAAFTCVQSLCVRQLLPSWLLSKGSQHTVKMLQSWVFNHPKKIGKISAKQSDSKSL